MRTTLPTITIRQPHAWAIMTGRKTVEIRAKPAKYRGPVLIHAGKNESDVDELPRYLADAPLASDEPPTLYFGCLLGVVDIVECRLIPASREFGLILANPRPIEPVQAKGKLAMLYDTDLASLVVKFPDLEWLQNL